MQLVHEISPSTELDGVGDTGMDTEESERTERKRKRERDRRSELTVAFEDLGSVLNDLDPKAAQGQGKKGRKDVDSTRLDKLHRTTALLRRMHRDMIGMQNKIRTLEQTKQPASQEATTATTDDGDKEVIVMVPTLTLQQPESALTQSNRMQGLDRRPSSETQYDVPSYAPSSAAYAAAQPQLADPYAPLATSVLPPYHHRSPSSQPYALPSDYLPLSYWTHEQAGSPSPASHYSYGDPSYGGYADVPPPNLQRSRSLSQGRCDTPESTHESEEQRNLKPM